MRNAHLLASPAACGRRPARRGAAAPRPHRGSPSSRTTAWCWSATRSPSGSSSSTTSRRADGAVPRPRADRPQPGLERRHAHAAAAAAQLRRRRHAPHGAEGRRDAGLLRAQRVVRRGGRPRRSSSGTSRPTWRRQPRRALQRHEAPRLALVSPIAHERLARLAHVDVEARNRELARYTEAMRRVAARRGVPFADVFTPMRAGDGRGAGAADDQRHPPERGGRRVFAGVAADRARLRPAPADTCRRRRSKRVRRAARARSARRTSCSSTASGR